MLHQPSYDAKKLSVYGDVTENVQGLLLDILYLFTLRLVVRESVQSAVLIQQTESVSKRTKNVFKLEQVF